MKRWKIAAAAVLAMGLSMGMSAGVYAQEKEYSDGRKAEGVWIEDKQVGPGRVYYKDGSVFEGFYSNGSLEGAGVSYETDGSKVIWTYFDNQANGLAVSVSKDGKIAPGFYEDHKLKKDVTVESWEGNKGIRFYALKKTDINNGKAIAVYSNGDIYVGDFINGKRQGWGTLFYAGKERFMGKWEDDSRNGVGFYAYAQDNDYLFKSGFWTNGKVQSGAYYYHKEDKLLMSAETDSKLHGPAVWINSDGTTTIYEYKDGKRSNANPDIYTDKDGNQFVGVKDGKTGSGLKVTKSGTVYIGDFKNGLPDGEVVTLWPKSLATFTGTYEAGKRTHGTMLWSSGSHYFGSFRTDKNSSIDKGIYRNFRYLSIGGFSEEGKLTTGTYTTFKKDGTRDTKIYKDGKVKEDSSDNKDSKDKKNTDAPEVKEVEITL